MSELVGKIFVTNDYSRFKKLKGNRELRKNISLEKSIRKSGIIIPIEVNGQFEILDGQNRFEFAKKIGIPIPYRIIDGLGIQEVIDLNSTTKPWTVMDYIDKYCLDENIEYINLRALSIKYTRIPISSLASAGEGYLILNSKTTKNIREGAFSFYNFEIFCQFLEDYYYFLSKTDIRGGQYSFFAFFNLYTTEVFDFQRLVNGIANKIEKINGNTNLDVVTEKFLEAHNFGLKEDSKLSIEYNINKKDKPVINAKRNTILLNIGG